MFIDHAQITVKAGAGGHGLIAFRRERYLPKGGPNGGDGGHGGDVVLKVDPQLTTLHDIHYNRIYKAKRGQHGAGSDKHGKNGESVIIPVPPGTIVKMAETGELLADLVDPEGTFLAAKGGAGGYGNAHFKSARNQSPQEATNGKPGGECDIELELKLLADVGLVGFPNAGKSTLLARISAAHPKVSDYPFTTLQPHLGIVRYGDYRSFVMADIPGLIEGASEGKGLGTRFLRHIERTSLLLYLIDPTADDDVETQFEVLKGELNTHSHKLIGREIMVVLTKNDTWADPPNTEILESQGHDVMKISAVTGDGVDQLVFAIGAAVEKFKKEATDPESS